MMKKSDRQKELSLIVLLACAVILSACGNAENPDPTVDVNAFGTAAVQTIEANYTETALANPTSTPAPTDMQVPLPTEPLPTQPQESIIVLPTGPEGEGEMMISQDTVSEGSDENAVLPIVPPTAIPQAILPTATLSAASVGDKAVWEGQTPEDNAHLEAGSEFDIVWYLRNTGTTTWTTDYCCRYFSNTNFSKRPGQRAYLQQNVAPNEIGECRIDAIAPTEPGTYKMAYVLSNAEDKNFYTVDITIIVD